MVDTDRELGFGQTTGSRGTLMGAGAVADACRAAMRPTARSASTTSASTASTGRTSSTKASSTRSSTPTFGYAAQLVDLDRETGAIERVVAAHDVGRAVNPMQCVGQIEGSVHMGLGYALTEDFPCDEDGRPTVTTLRGLGIIRAEGHAARSR